MRKTPRASRWLAAIALVGLVAAGCSSDSSDDSTSTGGGDGSSTSLGTVKVGVIASADHTPLHVAHAMGFFTDRGVEVDIQSITPGAGIMQAAMDSGDIHTGENTPFLAASGMAADMPIQLFCGSWKVINHSVIVHPDSDIPTADEAGWEATAKALEGKTIGVAAIGSNSQRWVELMMREAGADPTKADFVQGGAGPASIEPLTRGTVDAVASYPWFTETFETQGLGKVAVIFSENGPESFSNQQQNSWVAPKKWLDENPELAAAYCEAIDAANEFIADSENRDEVAEVLKDTFALDDEAVIDALLAPGGALDLLNVEISCSGLENTVQFLIDTEQIEASDDLTCDNLIWADAPRED